MIFQRQPDRNVGVAGHPPIAAGREADGADLGAVGHARTLELLAEEPPEERPQGRRHLRPRVRLRERREFAQEEDLLGRIAAADGVEQDEVVQLVGAEGVLGGLLVLIESGAGRTAGRGAGAAG